MDSYPCSILSFPPACGRQVKTGIQIKIAKSGFLLEFIPAKAGTGMTKEERISKNPSSPPFAKGRCIFH